MNKITIPISKEDIGFAFLVTMVLVMMIMFGLIAYLLTTLPFPANLLSLLFIGVIIFLFDMFFLAGELTSFLQRKNPFKLRGSKK